MRTSGETIHDFTIANLAHLRAIVRDAVTHAGLTDGTADDLALAVNELAVNAIQHANGQGRLTITPDSTGLLLQISDAGPGLPATTIHDEPAPLDAIGGRGIWMVRQLCRRTTINSTTTGLTINLFTPTA